MWASWLTAFGGCHQFFFREHLLELERGDSGLCPVSRLRCVFAFECKDMARRWAESDNPGIGIFTPKGVTSPFPKLPQKVYRAEPAELPAATARLDMRWIAAIGVSQLTTEEVRSRCREYWSGRPLPRELQPNGSPEWEWLFAGPLRVL